MRLTRRSEIMRIIAEIAALILLIISLVRDWFWLYKWWILGGLGILVLGGIAVAMAYHIRRRRLRYLEGRRVFDLQAARLRPDAARGTIMSAPIAVTMVSRRNRGDRDFSEELPVRSGTLVVIPHKATPKIAITSGLLAVVSLSSTMVLITNFTEATPGLAIVYIAVGVIGITSFGLGILVLRARSKALNSFRSEWQRLREGYTESLRVPDKVRRRIVEQRDALLISGDLIDADRASAVLRSLQERGRGPDIGL